MGSEANPVLDCCMYNQEYVCKVTQDIEQVSTDTGGLASL